MYLTSTLLLSLPALSAAQAQKPLGDQARAWYEKAKSYLPSQPTIPSAVKDPVGATAAKIASKEVTFLNMSNYEDFLTPDPTSSNSPQEYMILVSGGNKTCAGKCEKLEREWNATASVLAADLTAPKLGYINCDKQGVLCATWMAKPPTIWHIQRPVPREDQSKPASTVYVNYLNITETTTGDIVALHTGKKYETGLLYEGAFQPFDGMVAQYGLTKVVGYVVYAFGLVPSWAFMLVISLVSRTFM